MRPWPLVSIGAAAAVAGGSEVLARRLALADLAAPESVLNEAEWKLHRLAEMRLQRRSPHTVIIGASVLDADVDPDVMMRYRPLLGTTFNACLAGSETKALSAWWRILREEISPERIVMEVHPLMVHSQTSIMAESINLALSKIQPGRHDPRRRSLAMGSLTRTDLSARRVRQALGARLSGTALPTDRNRDNGHLTRFRDVPFEEGITALPPDWYEYLRVDPDPLSPDLDAYFAAVDAVMADVPDVTLVVSPLALSSTASTSRGETPYRHYGDLVIREAARRGMNYIDLRPHFENVVDFADPFHLRSWAIDRASVLLACGLADT